MIPRSPARSSPNSVQLTSRRLPLTALDQALVQTAGALSLGLRAQDHIARWGGGELLFLLPDSGLAAALVVAEGVRERVAARSIRVGSTVLNLTLSVAVANQLPPPEGVV